MKAYSLPYIQLRCFQVLIDLKWALPQLKPVAEGLRWAEVENFQIKYQYWNFEYGAEINQSFFGQCFAYLQMFSSCFTLLEEMRN
jgi:hypothetical protein